MNQAAPLSAFTLLGGRVRMARTSIGLAPTTDAVLLAAAVPAAAADRVLDVGAGGGAASLCLAARVPGCAIVGLERDRRLVAVARANAALSGMADRVTFLAGTIGGAIPKRLAPPFDHVLTNPPFLAGSRASRCSPPSRIAATVEEGAGLAAWLRACLGWLRPKGTLTLIHRADRLGDVLAALAGAGGIVVAPLWPRADGGDATRVIVRLRKGSRAPLRLGSGLVLHGAGHAYTAAAEAVLRHGDALDLGR